MIKLAFILITFLFCFAIMKENGVRRLGIFIIGIIFCPNYVVITEIPVPISLHLSLIYTLLISIIWRTKSLIENTKSFPFIYLLLLLIISHFCIGIFDERLSLGSKLYRPFSNFMLTFAMLFLSFCSINNLKDWQFLYKLLIPCSLILCIYGIFNYITKTNPIDAILTKEYNSTSFFQTYINQQVRFRVNSFIPHPITFGYITSILLLIFYSNLEKYRNSVLYISIIILLFINLLFSNSRTPIVGFFLGLIIITISTKNFYSILKSTFLGLLILAFLYTAIPMVQEKADSVTDIFTTGGKETGGSSLEMRGIQLVSSFALLSQNPVFGNGYGYIRENLGYTADENKRLSDQEFYGFESYAFQLLIEEGLFQIILVLALFIYLLIFFGKNSKKFTPYGGLGLAITFTFLFFIFATGTLGTWLFTMTILGVLIKSIAIAKANSILNDNTIVIKTIDELN